MQVGIHVVLLAGSEPGEVAPGRAEHLGPDGLGPTQPFALVAFLQKGELVFEEAQVAVGTQVFSGEDVSAHNTYAFLDVGDVFHGRAGEGHHIAGLGGGGAGDGHLAGQVQLAGVDYVAQGGQVEQGHRPHGLTLVDGRDVADLDTYVAGRMGTAYGMELGILDAAKGRPRLSYTEVHGSNLAQSVHAGLNVGPGFHQGEISVRR